MEIIDILRPVTFGSRVAEEEKQLSAYFVETDHWHKLWGDDVDIVYGPKGSGKSALYSLLVDRKQALSPNGILITLAENPRGTPAFQALVTDPPTTEREFISLWKLYLTCLSSLTCTENGISNPEANRLAELLRQCGLLQKQHSLQGLLSSAIDYVKRLLRPTGIEPSVSIDPTTGRPSGFSTKIVFAEPSAEDSRKGLVSVDDLLRMADQALGKAQKRLWMLLDRLDVAFQESTELEHNALRALFRVYLDFLGLRNIRLKIFLRTDIWRKITHAGFREASHITRHITIEWNPASLRHLIVRRLAQNDSILTHFRASRDDVLASAGSQEKFFYKVFPDQVEAGPRKSRTLDWMLRRTRDGTKQTAPRELIHLLNSLRDVQVRHLELGTTGPEGERLFSRSVFSEALRDVSRARLEQTLYAEYPDIRNSTEQLRGAKTLQSIASLAALWNTNDVETLKIARRLSEIGFFEERGQSRQPDFWVPPLYRDALDLVQGSAGRGRRRRGITRQ